MDNKSATSVQKEEEQRMSQLAKDKEINQPLLNQQSQPNQPLSSNLSGYEIGGASQQGFRRSEETDKPLASMDRGSDMTSPALGEQKIGEGPATRG